MFDIVLSQTAIRELYLNKLYCTVEIILLINIKSKTVSVLVTGGKRDQMLEKRKSCTQSSFVSSLSCSLCSVKTHVPTRNVPISSMSGNFTYFANASAWNRSHFIWFLLVY